MLGLVPLRRRLAPLLLVVALATAAGLRAPAPSPAPVALAEAGQGPGQAKLFILMLADQSILWEGIWVKFLSGGQRGVTYEAFVHCQHREKCLRNIERQDLFSIVPTVPSEHCANLLDPFLALLRAALPHSSPERPGDKFALVSHNSLPVKPFWLVHRTLTYQREGVAFLAVDNDVKRVKQCGLKASQFSVLSYEHAARLLEAAGEVSRNITLPKGCFGCLDEIWPLRAIYGDSVLQQYPNIPKLESELRTMWTFWGKKFLEKRPAAFVHISSERLRFFRSREGLCFARKFLPSTGFTGGSSLPDAFDKYVLDA